MSETTQQIFIKTFLHIRKLFQTMICPSGSHHASPPEQPLSLAVAEDDLYHGGGHLIENPVELLPPARKPGIHVHPPVQSAHPLMTGCEDNWSWNKNDKSHEVRLYGPKQRIAHFHPNWSNGTAGVRGTRVLNGGRFYWEINVSQR